MTDWNLKAARERRSSSWTRERSLEPNSTIIMRSVCSTTRFVASFQLLLGIPCAVQMLIRAVQLLIHGSAKAEIEGGQEEGKKKKKRGRRRRRDMKGKRTRRRSISKREARWKWKRRECRRRRTVEDSM